MNKKIFTLLAGAFLMFAAVFSMKAQSPIWDTDRLHLGDTVRSLKLGANPGYYHLRADSIVVGGVRTQIDADSASVLYMGKLQSDGTHLLFLDSIGRATKSYSKWANDQFTTNSKAEESAAALWCVNIGMYDQGKNIYFDFINKQQEELLEVEVFGYEKWGDSQSKGMFADNASHVGINSVPGGVSGWEFSQVYATRIHSRPLISYITNDTVAVLCAPVNAAGTAYVLDSVYVKIADANDVQNNLVEGVIYFRLTHAAPFVLSANDFNTMFGGTSTKGKLVFDQKAENNVFEKSLEARHIDAGQASWDSIMRFGYGNWERTNQGFSASMEPNAPFGVGAGDTTWIQASTLDSLGYIQLLDGNNIVHVAKEYLPGNYGGNKFLKITSSANPFAGADSILRGQTIFRMVYYPSGDSIYINPYQAAYLPTWDNDGPTSLMQKYGLNANSWNDTITSALFTFYADTSALQSPKNAGWSTIDTLDMRVARLKYGRFSSNFHLPYINYHMLYVSYQNLDGELQVTLNTNATGTNHKINAQINFDLYRPCSDVDSGKTTVPPNVYLIRNAKGEYLQVPLYSATDSASWIDLDDNVDPRYIPSFHWVIEQRYLGGQSSPVTITNREFEWLRFENVQLTPGTGPIKLRTKEFPWNRRDINFGVISWDDVQAGKAGAFIALDKKFKDDPYLGYEYISPDSSIVNTYSFNFGSGIDAGRYIGWKGDLNQYPNTDTTIYVNAESSFDKMYFTLDTIHEDEYGSLSDYGFKKENTNQVELVTLKRQAYRLAYKDPFKYNCLTEFCMAPGEDYIYSLTKKGIYEDFLGKPVFYLRHVYATDNKDPYFALVQLIDSTTTAPNNTQAQTALEAFLLKEFGQQLTDGIMARLNIPRQFNHGLFVANFEYATGKLKMGLRAETTTEVTTFRCVRDDDPLYRRFNTTVEGEANDDPKYLHFHVQTDPERLLFENTGHIKDQQVYWQDGKKNYLGIATSTQYPNMESHSSTTIYVDTAYVNRGTGYIKPQYLLAVRPNINEPAMGCNDKGEEVVPLKGYVEAYYLINAHDSAYQGKSTIQDYDYIWKNTGWVRLVFTRAIHANDHLYILGNHDLSQADIWAKMKNNSKRYDVDKLHAYALANSDAIHVFNIGAHNNKHHDALFSMRLIERGPSKDFIIESETTNRDTINGPKIAPCNGGWLKEDNGVMTLTPSDEVNQMGQAQVYNVYKGAAGEATNNDEIQTSNVTVVGGANAVTILNAAGKSVVISNILGQTVAKTVLTSDNEMIDAPKGVVIVAIDGEETVKTLVK